MPRPFLYGLLIGLAQLLATLVVFACGLHASAEGLSKAQFPESLIGFLLMMIVVGLAHLSLRSAAGARGEKTLGLGAAAKAAALTALVAGLCTGLFQWVYLAAINPALRDLQRAQIMERAGPELARLAPADAAVVTQKIDHATSAIARGVVYGVNTFLFSALLGVALAFIFRTAAQRGAAAAKAGLKSAH